MGAKWEHIWAYYKLPIAIILIVVYILGYTAYRHVTKKRMCFTLVW